MKPLRAALSAVAITVVCVPAARAGAAPPSAPPQAPTESAQPGQPNRPVELSRGQAVREAWAHNPGLTAARQQVEQAKARIVEARALPDPSLSAEYDDETGLLSPGSSPGQIYELDFDVPFPTKLRLGGKAATDLYRSAELDYTQVRQELAADTVAAYDALLVAQRHLEDLEQAKALADDFLAKTKARFDAGTVPEIDVIKAKVDRAQAETGLIAIQRQLATSRSALNRLLGRPLASPLELSDPLAVPPPLPPLDALIDLAAAHRPDLASLAAQRKAASASTKLARSYWLPDFSFGLARNTYQGDSSTFTTVAGISFPLFFWQHQKGQVAEARHYEEELSASSRDLEAQVALEVRTAFQAADTARRQAIYLRDQLLPEAQRAYDIASKSYSLGGLSALDLLDSKRTLLDAESELADALGAANDSRADLERAIGTTLPAANS